MRKTTFILATAAAAAFAATATAAPSKGKPPTTGTNCKPSVAVILTGKLAANGATAPFGRSVTVTGGNKASSAWKKLPQPLSIQNTSATKISRQDDSNPADQKTDDRDNIQARACKADTVAAALPSLTAVRVTAHHAG